MNKQKETKNNMTESKSIEEQVRDLVIKIGSMGGSFLGEHNMVFEPVLNGLIQEVMQLITNTKADEKKIKMDVTKLTFQNVMAKLFCIRRFDEKEQGSDYYAGWDNALDIVEMDLKELMQDIGVDLQTLSTTQSEEDR